MYSLVSMNSKAFASDFHEDIQDIVMDAVADYN